MTILTFLYVLIVALLIVMISINSMLYLRIKTIWRRIKLAYILCGIISLGVIGISIVSAGSLSEEAFLLLGILMIVTMLSGSIVSWSKMQVSEFTLKQAQDSIEHIIENGISDDR